MAVIQVTTENFEQEVLKSDKPVLVDFWASWCGPCQMLAPVIEELAADETGAKICKVNVDEQPKLAEQYRVMTIPTLMVFKQGSMVTSSAGVKPKKAIREMLSVK